MSDQATSTRRKRGDTREDGKVFWRYYDHGTRELWFSAEDFNRQRQLTRAADKKRYGSNPDNRREVSRRWRRNNPEKYARLAAKYREENRERLKQQAREWRKFHKDPRPFRTRMDKIKANPVRLLASRLRSRLYIAFKHSGYVKPQGLGSLLGTTLADAKAHLEAKFDAGMSWDNYGQWHIDHVVPFASAKSLEEVVRLCHYTNLQPLWAKDNLSKGAKLPAMAQEL